MTRDLTLKDATYERLADRTDTDETAADALRRLLDADAGAGGDGRRDRDQLAVQAMTLDELAAADSSDLTPAEYLAREHDVDAGAYSDDLELRAALDDADRGDVQGGGGAGGGGAIASGTATGTTLAGVDVADRAGGDQLADAAPTEVDQLAESALTIGDLAAADQAGLSPSAYLAREYDVDPSQYGSEAALLEAVRAAGGGAGR